MKAKTLPLLLATLVTSLAMLGAGCSMLAPRLEKPTLQLVNVKMEDGNLLNQRFTVRLKVLNPNDRELPVKGLAYTIELDGQPFGRGQSARSFVVPAHGEAEFDMSLDANLAGAILAIAQRKERNAGREVEYRLKGKVSIDLPMLRSLDFDQVGRFSL